MYDEKRHGNKNMRVATAVLAVVGRGAVTINTGTGTATAADPVASRHIRKYLDMPFSSCKAQAFTEQSNQQVTDNWTVMDEAMVSGLHWRIFHWVASKVRSGRI